ALESLVGAGLGEWVAAAAPEHPGGRRPMCFVPRPTSDTSDTSDARPGCDSDRDDGDGGGASDTPPPTPVNAPGAPGSPIDATADTASSNGRPAAGDLHRVSDVSDVGHDRCERLDPTSDGDSPQPGPEGECRTGAASVGLDPQPVLVTDAAGLSAVVTAVRASEGGVGLDTETTGLNPNTDRVRLIQVATPTAVYVIELFTLGKQPPLADLFTALSGVEVIGHHLQFDLRFLAPLGFIPGRVYDTRLASQVLYAGRRDRNNALPRPHVTSKS